VPCGPPTREARTARAPARAADPLPLLLSAEARPSLVLLGGAKCGSTDAWAYLRQRFGFAAGKSPRGFDWKEMLCLTRDDLKGVERCYRYAFRQVPSGVPTIDGGPEYVHLRSRHALGLNAEYAAVNMAYGAPDAAGFILLRDPIKRLRSEWTWHANANSKIYKPLLARGINRQVDIELRYLLEGPNKDLVRRLFREVDAVDAREVYRIYRRVVDGYNIWLAEAPWRCNNVSRLGLTGDGTMNISWCQSWPVVLPSLWYPLLLHWRDVVFRPRRFAVVQSEAYYARRSILDQLFPLVPQGVAEEERTPLHKQPPYGRDLRLSEGSVRRLRDFLELPNRRLRELLSRLPSEGVAVIPRVEEPGSWWTD